MITLLMKTKDNYNYHPLIVKICLTMQISLLIVHINPIFFQVTNNLVARSIYIYIRGRKSFHTVLSAQALIKKRGEPSVTSKYMAIFNASSFSITRYDNSTKEDLNSKCIKASTLKGCLDA
ncbi:hypothetical protein KFK09_011587 [Dendrobium nobile]|uniref:Uncharacterized protein n=1 Tax=Dendrobium nobile TaxID=94219 RepID=A0A8T3BG91_DENNO|nr:hypothetical protein KFK09_011587 [Dendrobium nobile]